MDYDPLRRGVAEFIGTFTLIFIGAGTILTTTKLFGAAFAQGAGDTASGLSLVAIAFAHGLAIAVMVSAVGHISGGHFNPAITFGFLITRRIKMGIALLYWLAQFGGAALAALLVKDLLPRASTAAVHIGVPALGHGVDSGAAFGLEAILTFFLVWVVFASAVDERGSFKSIAGLAIGLTITMDILFAGPLTGAAMNPARAFGPQLVGNHWDNGWVWYAGPVA